MKSTALTTTLLLVGGSLLTAQEGCQSTDDNLPDVDGYVLVDTGQINCYDDTFQIECPGEGDLFYGQDAQYDGTLADFTDNGDGTVTDNRTGLMWQQDAGAKMTFEEARDNAAGFDLAGHDDWRLPTIKELYSLMDFRGLDPSGNSSELVPFIDTDYFDFEYGDESAGERLIDAQYASSTEYVSETMGGSHTIFGVNFADGRIKGYGTDSMGGGEKEFFVLYVRGNESYGINSFEDNGDGTLSDTSTGLMWMQVDSGDFALGTFGDGSVDWEQALEWAENLEYAGYSDWRLPNAKELQSIVDYTRSPDTTQSAAIDPLFESTSIINEAGQTDYPCYWSSTTHANVNAGDAAAYVAFGRAMGYFNGEWQDVHGAGAQRSDPKVGDPSDYPEGHGPQGDAIRIYNYVRLVRGGAILNDNAGQAGDDTGDEQSGEEPPQEAIDACVDSNEEDSCQFETAEGSLSGTCLMVPETDQLACVPA